ncbi:MAG: hypothetical protein WAW86_06780 [Gammaproteobacteria bacterium]
MSHDDSNETKADFLTKVSAFGEGCASLISGAVWVGEAIDTAFGFKDSGYGLSWYGLGIGLGISLLTAAGSAYSHTILNVNNQSKDHDEGYAYASIPQDEESLIGTPIETVKENVSLTLKQKAALVGDFISDTGNKAGPVTSLFKISTKDHHIPFWGKMVVLCGATLFGGVASIADVRTCKNSMLDINRKKEAARAYAETTTTPPETVTLPAQAR